MGHFIDATGWWKLWFGLTMILFSAFVVALCILP